MALHYGVSLEELKASYYPRVAEKGRTVKVHIDAYRKDTEVTPFWTSRNESKPLKINLGASEVIQAYEMCIEGMRIGEIRRVKATSEFAFGKAGNEAYKISPNEDLIFDIELVSIVEPLPDFKFFSEGSGEAGTILFMHGWPDDETLFRPQIDYFKEKGYKCLFYCLPWFGPKENIEEDYKRFQWKDKGYSHEDLVDAIATKAYREVHGEKRVDEAPEKLILFAHDWGAFHAQILKVRHQHLVKQSVILDVDSFQGAYFPGWKMGVALVFLGKYYQYKLILSFFLSQFNLSLTTKWSDQVHANKVKDLKRMLDKKKTAEVNPGIGKQNYVYFNYQKDIMLRIMNLKDNGSEWYVPGSVEKKDFSKELMHNTLFLYGRLKPVMFHSDALVKLLNSSRAGMENSCAKAMKATHWVNIDAADETSEIAERFLLDASKTAAELKQLSANL